MRTSVMTSKRNRWIALLTACMLVIVVGFGGGFAPRFEGRVVTHFETRGIDAGRHAHDIVGVRRARG